MEFIDTHSHIYAEEFDDDRNEVVSRALEAGVTMMLLPAIDVQTYERQQHLEEQYPAHFRQMMGLHPTSVAANNEEALAEVERRLFAEPQRYVGVGEIGLDYYWDRTYEQQQVEVLTTQMRWAHQLDLPVALHVRNAYEEIFEVIRLLNFPTNKGIMHCFGGTVEQALEAVEMGYHIGIGGVVTFKKAIMAQVAQAVPLERIVIETDAPYLAPVPHRGRRNESAFVVHVAQQIANLRGISIEEVAEQTTHNARTLFSL